MAFLDMSFFYPRDLKVRGKKVRKVDEDFLAKRVNPSYPIARWIEFCREMLKRGHLVGLYEARRTRSKYVHVKKGNTVIKFRFSNHKPHLGREIANDCDFFVGVTHFGRYTTEDAINYADAILEDF